MDNERENMYKKKTISMFVQGLVVMLLATTTGLRQSHAQEGERDLDVLQQNLSRVWLGSLDLSKMSQGWGTPRVDQSVTGQPLAIDGVRYKKGVGTHAPGIMRIRLDKAAKRFTAYVGIDDDTDDARASVLFKIYADGQLVFDSGLMTAKDGAKKVDILLGGVETLALVTLDGGNGLDHDHADWAMAQFQIDGVQPVACDVPNEKEYILTPKPGPSPKINGPKIFGTRPGNPFIYRIPATGSRPMTFRAEHLPPSMELDSETGIITGHSPEDRGAYPITLFAKNSLGENRRPFELVVGDTLALTPYMGWNSWYIHYHRVADSHLREAADIMVDSGMADQGYMYVNIDDCWSKKHKESPLMDAAGVLLPNSRFPDMHALTDYIHAKGLRAGLHTSPGPWTCSGTVGVFENEQVNAQQFSDWGFDFLKYDFCSYKNHVKAESQYEYARPFALMGEILKNVDRDMVYNLCQYGKYDVWEWGEKVDGNSWRTTQDLGWMSGYMEAGLSNAKHYQYAKPGRWNDPDYILIGWVGNAHINGEGKKTKLSPGQQYQFMSMWSLMAAPLIFSGDMAKLDAFTLNILCNNEVIDIDQDPLGIQGHILTQTSDAFTMVKDLEDGSKAIGLFNTTEFEQKLSITWEALGIQGDHRVRDLWRQKDLGTYHGVFEVTVPRYGVSLLRVIP